RGAPDRDPAQRRAAGARHRARALACAGPPGPGPCAGDDLVARRAGAGEPVRPVARASAFPADLMHSAGAPLTALVAALASVLVNNLPAAVLLSSGRHLHTGALLLGLNVGPNLAVTGSLAVLLWWRAARASGATPSAIAYSRQGLMLAPVALLGALALGGG